MSWRDKYGSKEMGGFDGIEEPDYDEDDMEDEDDFPPLWKLALVAAAGVGALVGIIWVIMELF